MSHYYHGQHELHIKSLVWLRTWTVGWIGINQEQFVHRVGSNCKKSPSASDIELTLTFLSLFFQSIDLFLSHSIIIFNRHLLCQSLFTISSTKINHFTYYFFIVNLLIVHYLISPNKTTTPIFQILPTEYR